MPSGARRAPGRGAGAAREAIERFLRLSREPALLEPGEELLPLTGDNYRLEVRNSRVTLQAWDRTRNLVRRIIGVEEEAAGRLELAIERFARKPGRLFLIDRARPAAQTFERRGARMVFRERFRRLLARAVPDWKPVELSTEADLENSLSPVFPRALLRRGAARCAAIGAGPECQDPSAVLSFGLIWVDYLRRRERDTRAIEGLLLFLPDGAARATSLRSRYLDPAAVSLRIMTYSPEDFVAEVDPQDIGNMDTSLEVCHEPTFEGDNLSGLLAIPGVEMLPRANGSISLRVRGLEFARADRFGIRFGLDGNLQREAEGFAGAERLARELAQWRSPAASNREHPLYRRQPEAWLESQVRAGIDQIEASLLPAPVYGQVLAFAGGERGVMDLLAVDRHGRLAVLELKTSADLHLPLQALDYWMRVDWHLKRAEFTAHGYFPGIALRPERPRLFLISPALEFHPTTEIVLGYFSPAVDVVRIGLAVEWRKKLEVMFRLQGAERP